MRVAKLRPLSDSESDGAALSDVAASSEDTSSLDASYGNVALVQGSSDAPGPAAGRKERPNKVKRPLGPHGLHAPRDASASMEDVSIDMSASRHHTKPSMAAGFFARISQMSPKAKMISSLLIFAGALMLAIAVGMAVSHSSSEAVAEKQAPRVTTVGAEHSLLAHPSCELIKLVNISLSEPAKLYVEYQRDRYRLRTPTTESASKHRIPLMRMRAETSYEYDVINAETDTIIASGTFVTGALPNGLHSSTVQIQLTEGTPTFPLVLAEWDASSGYPGAAMWDMDGEIVWYVRAAGHPDAATQMPNGDIVLNLHTSVARITPLHEVVAVYKTDEWGHNCNFFHHEVEADLDDPDVVWTLGAEASMPPANLNMSRAQGSEIVMKWNTRTNTVKDIIHIKDFPSRIPMSRRSALSHGLMRQFFNTACDFMKQFSNANDWTHVNAVHQQPGTNNIVVSSRHLSQLYIFSPDGKDLLYVVGGEDGDFEFESEYARFWNQHSVFMFDDRHIVVFDNGNLRPLEQNGFKSRALQIELDFDAMVVREVWSYWHDPFFAASCCGSIRRVPDSENWFVTYGLQGNSRLPYYAEHLHIELTPNGQHVATYVQSSKRKRLQYRSYPVLTINGETEMTL